MLNLLAVKIFEFLLMQDLFLHKNEYTYSHKWELASTNAGFLIYKCRGLHTHTHTLLHNRAAQWDEVTLLPKQNKAVSVCAISPPSPSSLILSLFDANWTGDESLFHSFSLSILQSDGNWKLERQSIFFASMNVWCVGEKEREIEEEKNFGKRD